MIRTTVLCAVASAAVSGCALLSSPSRIHTQTETMRNGRDSKTQEIGMFATEANSRVIIANVNSAKFCAEPPPETQLTDSQTHRLLVEAALKGGDEAKIEAFRAYSTAVQQVYKRSHSNAMFRDASYYLCQAYLNGALAEDLGAYVAGIVELYVSRMPAEKQEPLRQQFAPLTKQLQDLQKQSPAEKSAAATSAYLNAQLQLATLGFLSLATETDAFYKAELAKEQGRSEAMAGAAGQVGAAVTQLRGVVDGIDSTTKRIEETTTSTDATAKSTEAAVKAISTKADEIATTASEIKEQTRD